MARKKNWEENLTPAEKESINMRLIDLQRATIIRGIDFNLMVSKSNPALQDWFIRHYQDKQDKTRLDAFDEWRKEIMNKKGIDEPFIRLGFIGETDATTGEVTKIKKIKNLKKPKKEKRQKNEKLNIWSGTKKELTYQCALEGKDLDETLEIVLEKFPDANPKSIGIWRKRAIKESK